MLRTPEQRRKGLLPLVRCKDGVSLSIQNSWTHHASFNEEGEPTHVEVQVYPRNRRPLRWDYEATIHPFIPIEEVEKFIREHGGMECIKREEVFREG
jgi:hypothetical protein